MKLRVSLCFLGLLLGLLSGQAFAHAVPHPDPGYTGATRFGENSCVECHIGNANTGPGNVKLTFNGQAVTTYTPGTTVPVQIVITDTGGGRLIWGFELTSRFANNTNAGVVAPRDTTTTTFRGDGVVSPPAVTYISHLNATNRPAATTFTYTINWTAPAAGSGQVIFNVAANAGNGDNTQFNDRIYSTELILTEAPSGGPAPSITSQGIVNAATFNTAPNNQVSRGQLISIFGSNLTASGTSAAQAIPLPTSLGGTSVSVNGKAIPLIVVSAGQINAQLPAELSDTGTATLTVTSGGQTSTQATVNLQVTSPGIFSVNSNGAGDGAILNGSKANVLVTPTNPAKAGDVVVIFCTGLGATKTPVPSGTAANGEQVLAAVTVTIGGKDAPVQFAGLAPGFVGLYQVNASVPSGVTGSVPVVINAGGLLSRADVTMSVQ